VAPQSGPSRSHESDLPDLPIEIREPLSILPGDVETYVLPLYPESSAVYIEFDSDGPIDVCLLAFDGWASATTIEERLAAAFHAVNGAIESRILFHPPAPGRWMLLLANTGHLTVNAPKLLIKADTANETFPIDPPPDGGIVRVQHQ